MTLPPDHWPRLKEVFADARALPADLRAAYLADACSGNGALHHEVEALLAVDPHATSFLETPAVLLADTMVPKLLEGQRIGPYEITSQIGAGGMGEVYRARDARLGRDVAIKILPPVFTSDPDRLARFDREARMLASLNHPHIGAIYGVEQSEGVPTLILELVEGPTLADRLATGPIPLTESLEIAAADCRGAGGRARARDRPSGSEAGQHQDHARGHRQGARLRLGQGRRGRRRRP